jgi:hypothetical protein
MVCVCGQRQASAALNPAKGSLGQGAGRGPRPDWKGAESFAPHLDLILEPSSPQSLPYVK